MACVPSLPSETLPLVKQFSNLVVRAVGDRCDAFRQVQLVANRLALAADFE
jgi:hypothetical protein